MNKLKKWQLGVTLLTSIAYFFYYFGRYSYAATIPFIQAEWNLTNTAVGLMATVLTLGYAIGQFINGYLIDQFGPRKMLTLGGILSTVANFFVSIASTFGMVLTGWFANGYFQAFGYGSCCKLYTNWFPPDGRGKPLGFNEALQSFSSTIIVPLSAVIIVTWGWRWVYIIPVLPLTLVSLVFYKLIRNHPADAGIQRFWVTDNDLLTPEDKKLGASDWKAAYKYALSDWRMVASYVSYGGSQFARFAIYTWVPLYIFNLTGNIITGGLVPAALALGGTVGSLFVGWLSDVMEKRWPVIFIGMAISAAALFIFALMPTAPIGILMLIMAVCGTGIEAVEVAYFLLPMDILDDVGFQATGVGTMNAFGKLFATFQGVMFGFLLDTSGFMNAFLITGMIALLSAFLVIPIRK